ncbi:MAG TPA: CBS domain-containing protein [Nevskia sp.]|nr:CBS domain-containing protein [Nevskia sp.]HET7796336.1 CBS domain-containing protein [Nevskia sp.]
MTRSLITVNGDETVENAMHLMTENNISSIVVEPDARGIWGILTRRDIVSKIVRNNKSPSTTKVDAIATRPVVSVPAETSIREAAEMIADARYSRLTVAQGDKIIGIVTETDIFNAVEKFGWASE